MLYEVRTQKFVSMPRLLCRPRSRINLGPVIYNTTPLQGSILIHVRSMRIVDLELRYHGSSIFNSSSHCQEAILCMHWLASNWLLSDMSTFRLGLDTCIQAFSAIYRRIDHPPLQYSLDRTRIQSFKSL